MVPSGWATTVRKEYFWTGKKSAREKLWKRRSVEKSPKRLFHLAWKSRQPRGIPTLPQPRLRLGHEPKPDISCATKTGHFNLLPTEGKAWGFGDPFYSILIASPVVSRPEKAS